jgi:protein involved in polysaccharide export with SLBB domain
MSDRFLCLLTAAALAAASQTEALAQGAMRAGQGPGSYSNRAELAQPPLGAPMAMPALPANGEVPSALVDPNHRLQQGDELTFKIDEDKDPSIPLVVSHTGEIVVEPLEQAVKIAGLTTREAANELKRQLEKDYYYHATVRLTLNRANQMAGMGFVYLSGEVQRVGQLPIYQNRPMMLSEAILQAGSFARYADDRKVKVTRSGPDGVKTMIVDEKAVIKEGQIDKDIKLQPGDRVFVPTRFFQN